MTDNNSKNQPIEAFRPDQPAKSDKAGEAGAADGGDGNTESDKISNVISNMADCLSSDDDEQAHILNAMQRRLEKIAGRTEEAKCSISSDDSEVFAKVEAAISNLTKKAVAEPEPSPSPDLAAGPAVERPPAKSDEADAWSHVTAETLTRHYEAEGLADAVPVALVSPFESRDIHDVADSPERVAPPAALPAQEPAFAVSASKAALAALADEAPQAAATGADEVVYVAGAPNSPSDNWLAERFEDLAARLDALTGGNVADASLTALLDRLTKLEDRIDAALAGAGANGESDGSLHDIELCIAEIANQLETTNTEVARLAEIEQQITQFTQRIADGGEAGAATFDPQSIADLVAERMASRPVALAAGDTSYGDLDGAGIGQLTVMIKDFMNERRTEGDHANAVLDTMQQTIIRLLDRMDALEAVQRAPAPMAETWTARSEVAAASARPALQSPPVDDAAAPVPANAGLDADDDLFEDEGAAAAFGRRNAAEQHAQLAPATVAEFDDDGQQSLERLKKVVDEIDDEPEAREGQPAPAVRRDRRPGANRRPPPADVKAGALPRREARRQVAPIADRSRFVNAARAVAASANQRVRVAAEEARATEGGADELVLAGDGQATKPKAARHDAKKAATSSTRTRLLVAALALLVVGLGATKFFSGVKLPIPGFGSAVSSQQDSAVKSGANVASAPGSEAAPAANPEPATAPSDVSNTGEATPPQAQQPTIDERLVQPVAIGPQDSVATSADARQPVGGISRKQLPSARVGPLSMRLAAANGDASAQFAVAARFAEGRGVSQDFEEAVKWYQRSAASSFALSQYRLGTLYERGLGVKKDVQRARIWYERAAAKGNIKAMHNLAVLAAGNGAGTPDYKKAARWFTAAAEHGLADSQFNLAILYQHGLGVEKNEAQAYQWFSLAALAGDGEAGKRKAEVAASMGAVEAAEIDRLVAQWQRRPADKVANDPHVAGQQWQRSG